MEEVANLINLVMANKEITVALVLAVVAVLKLTAWGKANSKALELVVSVIEGLDALDVKSRVAANESKQTSGVQDAIEDAVAKADKKKTPASTVAKLTREVFRGVLPKTA